MEGYCSVLVSEIRLRFRRYCVNFSQTPLSSPKKKKKCKYSQRNDLPEVHANCDAIRWKRAGRRTGGKETKFYVLSAVGVLGRREWAIVSFRVRGCRRGCWKNAMWTMSLLTNVRRACVTENWTGVARRRIVSERRRWRAASTRDTAGGTRVARRYWPNVRDDVIGRQPRRPTRQLRGPAVPLAPARLLQQGAVKDVPPRRVPAYRRSRNYDSL